MESIPENNLLKYNCDTLYEVRKMFNLHEPGAMKQAVDTLDEWIKKQPHFIKKDFDKRYLEMTIIVSKGSIERAKSRVDKACTLRTLMPHLFGVFDLRKYFKEDLKDVKHVVLPNLTKSYERIYIFKCDGKEFSDLMLQYLQACCMFAEYIRRHDYAQTHYVIIDFTDLNYTALLQRFTLHDLQELAALLLECCGFRTKGIHIVSNSKMVEILVKLLKQVIPAKLRDRLYAHKDTKPLTEMFGDVLPKEYGGKERSIEILREEWIEELMTDDHTKYMLEMSSAKTDEALRQKDIFNEQYLGMPGTFRSLSVD